MNGLVNGSDAQAVKTAATVRNRVLTGFDGLIPIFADVELFLGDFRGDVNIRNASVALTVTVLDAIERAIGFFISNECKSWLPSPLALGELMRPGHVKF